MGIDPINKTIFPGDLQEKYGANFNPYTKTFNNNIQC